MGICRRKKLHTLTNQKTFGTCTSKVPTCSMILLFAFVILANSCNSASSSADFTFCLAASHDFPRCSSRSAQDDIKSLIRPLPENSFKSSESPASTSGSSGLLSCLTSFFQVSPLSLSFFSHSLMRSFSVLDFVISRSSFSVSSSSDLCFLASFLT